jgi:hypothetical protein
MELAVFLLALVVSAVFTRGVRDFAIPDKAPSH